jgi:lipopolysaccharide transport system permease protein
MANTMRYYIDVMTVLAKRDFKIRYRNSMLGFLWSLLNPLAYMAVLTLVFAFLLRVNIPNFPAWELSGLLVWRYFSIGTAQSLTAISDNPSLVSKVRLSRYVLVLSNNIANFIGAALEFIVLFPILMYFGVGLTPFILFLPVILVMEFVLIFGISLALSSLNLKYRDFYQLWEVSLQLGFFLSPIVYEASLIPQKYSFAYSLNPVTRLIESTRDILLQQRFPTPFDFATIMFVSGVLTIVGFLIFRTLEPRFAEDV